MSRGLMSAVLAFALAAMPAPSAVGHGGPCRASAQEPRVEQGSILGKGRFNCATNHARLRLRVCLLKKVRDGWDARDCRNFSRRTVTGVEAETAKFCHPGTWRTRARGVAINKAGEVVHRDVDRSPELRIRRC